uniref:AcidPPc domain-containing protein n=1 Tax=Rhabditophanes sp. KR3021 TaxID=114890 RepID=A0AC35TNU5_9BILA
MTLGLLAKSMPYREQGFFCNDVEIYNPFRPDTIPAASMSKLYNLIYAIIIPATEFLFIKFIWAKRFPAERDFSFFATLITNTIFFVIIMLSGDLLLDVTANIAKRTISRLRPNYMDVCKPANLDVLCPYGSQYYVSNYTCTGLSDPDLHYAFPSGHSAHSAYFAVVMIFYLQARFIKTSPIKFFLQFFTATLAIFVCLTRVRDFKHRLSDVAGGVMLGTLFGLAVIFFVLENFKSTKKIFLPDNNKQSSTNNEVRKVTFDCTIGGDTHCMPFKKSVPTYGCSEQV